jgi:hypothetical protein
MLTVTPTPIQTVLLDVGTAPFDHELAVVHDPPTGGPTQVDVHTESAAAPDGTTRPPQAATANAIAKTSNAARLENELLRQPTTA